MKVAHTIPVDKIKDVIYMFKARMFIYRITRFVCSCSCSMLFCFGIQLNERHMIVGRCLQNVCSARF